jgi:uncharacterized protein
MPMRRLFLITLSFAAVVVIAGLGLSGAPVLRTFSAAAQTKTAANKVAIQVNQNDKAVMDLALNNAKNIIEYYKEKGETVAVEIVTYGPGLHMLRADTSPVKDRLKRLKELAFPGNVQYSACNNTKQGMEKTEGKEVPILTEATLVPSGVVRLIDLQEKGWSYLRP